MTECMKIEIPGVGWSLLGLANIVQVKQIFYYNYKIIVTSLLNLFIKEALKSGYHKKTNVVFLVFFVASFCDSTTKLSLTGAQHMKLTNRTFS